MKRALSLSILVLALECAAVRAQAPAPPASAQTPPKLAPGAVPAGFDGSPYAKAREISARIMNFTIEPNAIQPGQSAVLEWAAENPSGVSIDPGVGRVLATGSMIVKPDRTTSYTLKVGGGPNNTTLTRSVTVTVAGTTPLAPDAAASAPPVTKAVPRLNGKPDLSGVYGSAPNGGGRGGNPAGDGPVLKPGAEKFRVVRPANDTGFFSDCMPVVPPQGFGVYEVQIVQGANTVAILNEFPGTFRVIPTHGGPQPEDPGYTWQGNSIGHWEGDTLVVDTRGFNEKQKSRGFTIPMHCISSSASHGPSLAPCAMKQPSKTPTSG